MKYITSILVVLIAALLVSCGPQVTTAQPTEADLSQYQTFAYLPNADIELRNSNVNQDEVNQRIVETVNTQMQDQGYKLNRDNPDLLVLISVKKDRETETTTDPVYATYPYGSYGVSTVSPYYNNYYFNDFYNYGNVVGYDTDTYQYTEGTLIVSLIDRATKNTVWKGISSDAIYSGSTTDEIVALVDDIFEEYPIKGNRAR
ncbi:DUF4136 domain-containing protein [Neolewinella litorea]|nr:DUF4136 domain-containing protein [Neolewinella litorea]